MKHCVVVIFSLFVSTLVRTLLTDLIRGTAGEAADLDDMLSAVLADNWPVERLEVLLKVILRAGAYESAFAPTFRPG